MIKKYQIEATKKCSATLISAALKEYGVEAVQADSEGRVEFHAKSASQAKGAAEFVAFVCKEKGLVVKPLS